MSIRPKELLLPRHLTKVIRGHYDFASLGRVVNRLAAGLYRELDRPG